MEQLHYRSTTGGTSRSSTVTVLSIWRGWLKRFLLMTKLNYLVWTCSVLIFLSFLLLFQMFLPGAVTDNSSHFDGLSVSVLPERLSSFLKMLEFGSGISLKPVKILKKFQFAEDYGDSANDGLDATHRSTVVRKPKLALLFGDLNPDPVQLLVFTVATALQEIGYDFEVYSSEGGSSGQIWEDAGVPVAVVRSNDLMNIAVDWLKFDGIIVNSIEASTLFSCLTQDPFRSIPVIWTLHENSLALRTRHYLSRGKIEIIKHWKKLFNRSTVVVFPNHALSMAYSSFDSGNYYVISGSPNEVWQASVALNAKAGNIRAVMGYEPDDIVIAIVGSSIMYSGLLLEHTVVLQALLPVFKQHLYNESSSHVKIAVLSADTRSNFGASVEAIAGNLSYPTGYVKHMIVSGNESSILSAVDLVVYGSFLEEQSFPEVLIQTMFIGKPVIVPNLAMIKRHVHDRVNGYIFPKETLKDLTSVVSALTEGGQLSPSVANVTNTAKSMAKDMLVQEVVTSYAILVKHVMDHSYGAHAVVKKLPNLVHQWRWDLFEKYLASDYEPRLSKSKRFLNKVEEELDHSHYVISNVSSVSSWILNDAWRDVITKEIMDYKRRREEEMIRDRIEQSHGSWEDIYRYVRRSDHSRNELRERDDRELERTGQPICIYEPYFGEGVWPFLHSKSLFRGVVLSGKGKRPKSDDIDAPSRLALLHDPYYRDVLGEFGVIFAVAYRIDRIHRNAWIGFQSWRATAKNASLSNAAEKSLLSAIERKSHGDALYFWVRMDADQRNLAKEDFWSFCDTMNAGKCREVAVKALKTMYGINGDVEVPPMPGSGTWSVMSSWALPTRSFLEFAMFSRMFVDALDAELFDEHHATGQCLLSSSKEKHCYTRMLEVLINVWAYHSARGIVYVDPETGEMQEQHPLRSRRGRMWVKWFSYSMLKSMDEELAEIADADPPKRRWLWPSTGEIIWQGMLEREKALRDRQRENRKHQSKQRQKRMRRRHGQKVIGKFINPHSSDSSLST